MRKTIISCLLGMVLFAACKEDHSLVTLINSIPPADTSYLASAEAPEAPKNVLIEEFTGANCPNCPGGHQKVDSLKAQYGSALHAIAYHFIYPAYVQTLPAQGHQYDFRTQIGTDIENSVYSGVSGIPSGGVDRFQYESNLLLGTGSWGPAVAARTTSNSPVNLYVASSYNPSSDTVATITTTIKYVTTTAHGQNLSIAIVEDSLLDVQDVSSVFTSNYVFNNIFRDMVTTINPTAGDPLLATYSSATIPAGLVNVRRYMYKVTQGPPQENNAILSPQHCRVIAFVTDSATSEVLQSAECPLVQ